MLNSDILRNQPLLSLPPPSGSMGPGSQLFARWRRDIPIALPAEHWRAGERGCTPLWKERHTKLVARALVRGALSRYVEIPPATLHFSKSQHGKPREANPGLD